MYKDRLEAKIKYFLFLSNMLGVNVWNPAFDVTPANLITGIITEKGVFSPGELSAKIDEYQTQ